MGNEAESQEAEAEVTLRCDFCGEEAVHIRRVALDRDYDRLQTPHPVQYACDACSRRKEGERGSA